MERYEFGFSTSIDSKSSIESQYQKMEIDREIYLERARESAELTIPYLYPPAGSNQATTYPTPYQAIGARGVMNLASKLMLALFPPQAPFFRLDVDDLVYRQIQGDPQQKATIEQGLAKIEKAVMDSIERNNDRVAVYEALKHLIVSGNALLKLTDTGLRVYRLDNYVVKRDPQGKILKIIIKESLSPNTLPKKLSQIIGNVVQEEQKIINLFTCIKREKNNFSVMQEVKGKIVNSAKYDLIVDAASATTSATNAASSATAAASSATAASGSASTASTQASNASTSASTASTQATNAASSATAAASSASAASTSATNAATSATAAASSAAAAASGASSVKVSANATTAGLLLAKLTAGSNITLTETNDGGNETVTVTAADNSIPFSIALGG